MTIEEINEKCVSFHSVCEEMKELYRKRLSGEKTLPESQREGIMMEAIRRIEFLADVDDVSNEERVWINVDGNEIARAVMRTIRNDY